MLPTSDLWRAIYGRLHPGANEYPAPLPPHYASEAPQEPWYRDVNASIPDDVLFSDDPTEDAPPGREYREEEAVGEEAREEAAEKVKLYGPEAIAWYCPIHFFGPDYWGIWIHERLFYGHCANAVAELPGATWNGVRNEILASLIRHESFHAAVELFGLVMEDFAALGANFKKPAKDSDSGTTGSEEGGADVDVPCAYRLYKEQVYQPSWPGPDCFEEGLATAFELDHSFETRGLEWWLRTNNALCPPAYSEWRRYEREDARRKAVTYLTFRITDWSAGPLSQVVIGKLLGTPWSANCWFPDPRPDRLSDFGPIPVRGWTGGQAATARFDARYFPRPMKDFIKCVRRKYDVTTEPGGRHPHLVSGSWKIAYPTRKDIPEYVVKELAAALGIPWQDLVSQCVR